MQGSEGEGFIDDPALGYVTGFGDDPRDRPASRRGDDRVMVESIQRAGVRREIGEEAEDAVLVGSTRSLAGRPVPIAAIQDAAERLVEDGEIDIDVATVGYRSAFIGAALAALPGDPRHHEPSSHRPRQPGVAADDRLITLPAWQVARSHAQVALLAYRPTSTRAKRPSAFGIKSGSSRRPGAMNHGGS